MKVPDDLPAIDIAPPRVFSTDVAAALELEIIFGDLPQGMRLTEEIICKRTGVSRSPVREALLTLEQDGLLVREPRKGVRVSYLSVADLEEVYTCREPIEVLAARLAAQNATATDIKELHYYQNICEERLAANDVRGHFKANVEMSRRMYEAAHNRTLMRLVKAINKQVLRYRFVAYERSRRFREESVQANAKLVEAIAAGDPNVASRMARRLIRSSLPTIRQYLQNPDRG